ncbi:Leucine-rich repeat (LRR) family protein [Striga hermonthica]|uniref:Leucine-rich repeat (LRR) family protein n=1 Tax=Striga hermonthica TaxID=68872 RepID=A0A9N7MHH9_STRHE|nr:Leucine-rich repeat (LRR) family protein [Striga hermonthica]
MRQISKKACCSISNIGGLLVNVSFSILVAVTFSTLVASFQHLQLYILSSRYSDVSTLSDRGPIYNKLTGPIRGLPPNLNELALKSNSLSGPLGRNEFSGLTRLVVAELSENSLTGEVGSWFFLLPALQQADLAGNQFTAVNVAKPPPASELVAVDLSYNQIEGLLTENFSEYPALRSLSLRYNRLRGPIPGRYGGRGSPLRRLYLDGNYLNGSPPEAFFSGGGLDSGSLGDNCLERCPARSGLCLKSQKPAAICRQAYGGKPKS